MSTKRKFDDSLSGREKRLIENHRNHREPVAECPFYFDRAEFTTPEGKLIIFSGPAWLHSAGDIGVIIPPGTTTKNSKRI